MPPTSNNLMVGFLAVTYAKRSVRLMRAVNRIKKRHFKQNPLYKRERLKNGKKLPVKSSMRYSTTLPLADVAMIKSKRIYPIGKVMRRIIHHVVMILCDLCAVECEPHSLDAIIYFSPTVYTVSIDVSGHNTARKALLFKGRPIALVKDIGLIDAIVTLRVH